MIPEKYKNITFDGGTFPDDKYRTVSVKLNDTIKNEYIPALEKALPDKPKSLKLFLTAMTHQEGFNKGTRSYRTNNPGNIGNTDSGANKKLLTLEDGIRLQCSFIEGIAAGKNKNYPLGKQVVLKPYYSPEIAANPQYGIPPYLPGYKFTYTGQLDQFIKIYSTGARATNSYLNVILSYMVKNGIPVAPQTLLSDIVKDI